MSALSHSFRRRQIIAITKIVYRKRGIKDIFWKWEIEKKDESIKKTSQMTTHNILFLKTNTPFWNLIESNKTLLNILVLFQQFLYN